MFTLCEVFSIPVFTKVFSIKVASITVMYFISHLKLFRVSPEIGVSAKRSQTMITCCDLGKSTSPFRFHLARYHVHDSVKIVYSLIAVTSGMVVEVFITKLRI